MSSVQQCTWGENALHFESRTQPPDGERTPGYWFIFQNDLLLTRANGQTAEVPFASDARSLGISPTRQLFLGHLVGQELGEVPCWAAEVSREDAIPDGLAAEGLRPLYPRLGEVFFGVAGRALQIVAWDRTHRYCGQCGAQTESAADERARRCPACSLVSYPPLSPAIIIAVVSRGELGDRILLARNHRFPTGRYSVIAGFVEPGETLEECARREVCEEVGLRIKNIRYFGSQPWPFPHSLMIAFTAEYDGGEIELADREIAEAGWFTAGALPGLPPPMSIARRLIDWFAAGELTQPQLLS